MGRTDELMSEPGASNNKGAKRIMHVTKQTRVETQNTHLKLWNKEVAGCWVARLTCVCVVGFVTDNTHTRMCVCVLACVFAVMGVRGTPT